MTVQDELHTILQTLLPTTAFTYENSGSRGLSTTFEGYQNAAIGVFAVQEGAPFYVLSLSRGLLVQRVEAAVAVVDSLLALGRQAVRKVQPVESVGGLSNAAVALRAMSAAASTRDTAHADIATVPSFIRFQTGVDQFLKAEGSKAAYRGELVDSPDKARSKLKTGLLELRTTWEGVLTSAALWATSMESYKNLRLPSSFAASVLSSALSVLTDRVAALEAMSPTERLSVLRDTVLECMALKSAVSEFTSFSAPTLYISTTGTAEAYADTSHPVTRGVLPIYSDVALEGSSSAQLLVDGQHSCTLDVPGSYVGQHTTMGTSWETGGKQLRLTERYLLQGEYVTNSVVATLPSGTASIMGLCTALTTTLTTAYPVLLAPSKTAEAGASISSGVLALVLPSGDTWDSAAVGDAVVIDDWGVYGVVTGVHDEVLTADVSGVPDRSADVVIAKVGSTDYVGCTVQCSPAELAVQAGHELVLEDVTAGACQSLLFVSGVASPSTRTTAEAITTYINTTAANVSHEGSPLVEASVKVTTLESYAYCVSTPASSAVILCSYFGKAAVEGATYTVTLTSPLDNPVGMFVCLYDAVGDEGLYGIVSAASEDKRTLTVAFPRPPVNTSASVAVGTPPYAWTDTRGWYFLEVVDGVNQGVYGVATSAADSPLEVNLVSMLPQHTGLGGSRVVSDGAELQEHYAEVKSLSTGVESSVEVTTSSYPGVIPQKVASTTMYMRPSAGVPRRLALGDTLEVVTATGSSQHTVVQLDTASGLVGFTPNIRTSTFPLPLSTTSLPPFCRLKKGVHQNYQDVAQKVGSWVDAESSVLVLFRRLDAALNGMFTTSSPTSAQWSPLQEILSSLREHLVSLSGLLEGYTADVVPEVDALLRAFRAKGLDRAVDLLLSGDFPAFFGVDSSTASYLGNAQAAIRDLQRSDLATSSRGRLKPSVSAEQQTLASVQNPDGEYTLEQLDSPQALDYSESNSPEYVLP